MIEFIGSTASGKTTLIKDVERKLSATAKVSTAFQAIAGPLGLRDVAQPTAQNLIQELAGLPSFVAALGRNKAYLAFALRMLARQGKLTLSTLSYVRNLERTLGVYEMIKHHGRGEIILVDEGTLLSAHSLFVYGDASYSPDEITEFARLVPLPDLIVYVKARTESMIERTLQRSDPPKEMRSADPGLIEKYIRRADAIFEQLAKADRIRERILIVENSSFSGGERSAMVDSIADFIRRCLPGGAQ